MKLAILAIGCLLALGAYIAMIIIEALQWIVT